MNRFKHLLRPLGIGMAVLGVLAVLGFVERTADRTPVSVLDVRVKGGEGLHFIDEETIRRELMDQGDAVLGVPLGEVDIPAIESRLRNIPSVADVQVYHTMDGVLHVKVEQRVPIVRVFDRNGNSFYIDKDGYTMPMSQRYTARVPVVTGHLWEPGVTHGVSPVMGHDSITGRHRSDEIHRLALFLRNDPLWNALIDHIVVTPSGEFELLPKIGGHRILIGDGSELEQRFAKLRLFYEKGMPQADWRRYARIDLRFAGQIVCTKRSTP